VAASPLFGSKSGPGPVLWLPAVVAGLGALAGQLGGPWPRRIVTGAALEELLTAPLIVGDLAQGFRVEVFAPGLLLVVILLLPVRLPDAVLPLRGVWLRRLIAAAALACVVGGGPWAYLLHEWGRAGLPWTPAIIGLAAGAWLVVLTGSALGGSGVAARGPCAVDRVTRVAPAPRQAAQPGWALKCQRGGWSGASCCLLLRSLLGARVRRPRPRFTRSASSERVRQDHGDRGVGKAPPARGQPIRPATAL